MVNSRGGKFAINEQFREKVIIAKSYKMHYEDSHRTFLQMLMHNGIMSDYDVEQATVKLFNYNKSSQFYIAFINLKLQPLGMMIKSACCEFTGETFWMLMSTTVDNVASFQTQFSPGQLELLQKVFTEIIGSPDGNVPSTVCLNFCPTLENYLTKASADEFLNDAVQRKWLDAKDGKYYMGVRSIIELMPYFRATFEEGFNNCPLCKQAVFHGRRCENCQVVSHLYCLATFARVQNPLKCKNCSNPISTDDLPDVPERTMNSNDTITAIDAEVTKKRMKRSRLGF